MDDDHTFSVMSERKRCETVERLLLAMPADFSMSTCRQRSSLIRPIQWLRHARRALTVRTSRMSTWRRRSPTMRFRVAKTPIYSAFSACGGVSERAESGHLVGEARELRLRGRLLGDWRTTSHRVACGEFRGIEKTGFRRIVIYSDLAALHELLPQ